MTVLGQDDFNRSGNLNGSSAQSGGTWYFSRVGSVDPSSDATDGARVVVSKGGTPSGTGRTRDALDTSMGDGSACLTDCGGWYEDDGSYSWLGGFGLFVRGDSATGPANLYLAYVDGAGVLSVYRLTSGGWTVIASVSSGKSFAGDPASLSGISSTPIRVRLKATSESPTSLQARAWYASDSEPGTWIVDTTDNTSGNQRTSGTFGISAYYESSSASSTTAVADDFLAEDDGVVSGAVAVLMIGSRL